MNLLRLDQLGTKVGGKARRRDIAKRERVTRTRPRELRHRKEFLRHRRAA